MTRLDELIRQQAGDSYEAGERLFQAGQVREKQRTDTRCVYAVGPEGVEVAVERGAPLPCGCGGNPGGLCAHQAAACLAALSAGQMEIQRRRRAMADAPGLLALPDAATPVEGSLHIQPTLRLSASGEASLSLKAGEERLYAVRSLPQFLDALRGAEPLRFGKHFTLQPGWMRPDPPTQALLDFCRGLLAFQPPRSTAVMRELPIPGEWLNQLFERLRALSFRLEVENRPPLEVARVLQARVPLHFRVEGSLHGLMITGLIHPGFYPLTADCGWALLGRECVQIRGDQRPLLEKLWGDLRLGRAEYAFSVTDSPEAITRLIPYLQLMATVEISPQVERLVERRGLKAQVYIDRDGEDITVRTRFLYGEQELDPFAPVRQRQALQPGEKLLLRDAAGERKVLDLLAASGFSVRGGRVYLSGAERIFAFMTEGITQLGEAAEVFASSEFRRMTPRRPRLGGQMRLHGSVLDFLLSDEEEPLPDVRGIMEALARRRRYFRLKDGAFLDLSGLEGWEPLAEALTETGPEEELLPDGALRVSAFRAVLLSALLEDSGLPVQQDDQMIEALRALRDPASAVMPPPEGLDLRPYQQRGYEWLTTLDRLRMGGVLADDMGLGKTVQVIALLKRLKAEEGGPLSLVVAPTSLTYNWLSEFRRFAPELRARVLSGTQEQRAATLRELNRSGGVDVLITSYPLLRRDIGLMRVMDFRLAVLDEAQHIKNAGSVGSQAARQLSARTRFALTGTPMENHPGELWSIFDYALPGYLGTYPAFLRRYQDGERLGELKRRIEPFLLRRLKTDVLPELPDKLETVLTAAMPPEQQRVYAAALSRLRERVSGVLSRKGLSRGQLEVLSALTELREICCHPALVLDDYVGSSGKTDLLLDLLPGAIASGHRVLLFSQFTRMLRLLLRPLQAAGWHCLYLDGDTPAAERLPLCERFNRGEGDVFLISLKAGGTGLNLTGADTVIHFDPWWNPAVEDQATDRAHRIGQTRKVSVLRLVTHDTIEERVLALGEKKRALFDQLVTAGEHPLGALTEEDVRALLGEG
ncbi:MAG: DEAD/DEAH box helicase [Clostridia bacterium]|nr:DEAD/DEAH box helicase [Clostridia bacterium]